jgi:XTP/dITP diphosphohydrolase
MDALTLVIATRNQGKIEEIRQILSDLGFILQSLEDYPELPEVPEDGQTFRENARKKAQTIAAAVGRPALADDSGLEVAALGGRPGVYSARYAADRTEARPTDADNYRKLLEEMRGIPWDQRQARFVCEIVLAFPDGRTFNARGTCEGLIALEPRGEAGFGYDPVFWLPDYNCTVAQAGLEIKNRISHRAQALKQLQTLMIQLQQEEISFLPLKSLGT